jgi:hypothetical protein
VKYVWDWDDELINVIKVAAADVGTLSSLLYVAVKRVRSRRENTANICCVLTMPHHTIRICCDVTTEKMLQRTDGSRN